MVKAFIVGKRVFFLGNHVKAVNNTVFEKSVKKSHFIIACNNGHLVDMVTKFNNSLISILWMTKE